MRARAARNPRSVSREDAMIGQRIRLRRLELRMGQREVGAALNPPVTFQQVQKYEQGVSRMACSTAIQMCEILKIDPNELLGVKSAVKQAIDPDAYELALEFQKLSPKTRGALLKFARLLAQEGHGSH